MNRRVFKRSCPTRFGRQAPKSDGGKGFSLLELIIAIALIAIVIGGVLLLIAGNLNVMQKANEIMIATAMGQYQIESVKNIDFPPVYYDRQDDFGEKKNNESEITVGNGADFTPLEFSEKFKVERYVIGYDSSGNPIVNWETSTNYDQAMLLKIIVYVLRKKDNSVILRTSTYISRNGLY